MQTPPVFAQIQNSSLTNNEYQTRTITTCKIIIEISIHENIQTQIGSRTIFTVFSVIYCTGLIYFCRKQVKACLQFARLQAKNNAQHQIKAAYFYNIISLIKYTNHYENTHGIYGENSQQTKRNSTIAKCQSPLAR